MKLKILITGSKGFLGKNFLHLYKKKYDLYECNSNKIKNNIYYSNSKKKYKSNKFSGIIDFAWKGINGNKRNSKAQYQNITDVKKLLNFVDTKNLSFLISIGSQAEYKPTNYILSENSITKPITNYGKAKLKKFYFLKYFCKKNKIKLVWFRLFSSYGPFDNNFKLLTYILTSFIKNRVPNVTKGSQIWNLLYVEDVCSAIKNAIENKKYKGIINLAHNKSIKLKSVITKASKITRYDGVINFGGKDYRKDEVWSLKPNLKKIFNLGWKPKYSLSDGIIKTYKFLKKN